MSKKRILIIGLVWPEPTSSAAGTRIIQLVHLFLSEGYEVVFASAASKGDFSFNLPEIGVKEQQIVLNDSSFNTTIKEFNPDIVLFDRFVMEEQYGWRVRQECPHVLQLLDTEDLHFLRNSRQHAIKSGIMDLYSDMAKREIASILRCDLSLIISEVEMDVLKNQFRIDSSILYYLPFLEEELGEKDMKNWKTFEDREGFVFIGNYLHEPNWHTLQILKTQIWPILRKRLPNANLHIYGAYASQKVTQLHNPREKFLIHGRAKDAREAISKHKVLLAPIQFGAGLKGKFIDALHVGTPSATTSIGAEAMKGGLDWNGIIADNLELYIDKAVELYQNKNLWLKAQQNGILILKERYLKSQFTAAFVQKINEISSSLTTHRQHNFIGQILQYHAANSTKYMSLWIEEKNKSNI